MHEQVENNTFQSISTFETNQIAESSIEIETITEIFIDSTFEP